MVLFFYSKGHPTMALGVLFPLPRVSPHGVPRGYPEAYPPGMLFPHSLFYFLLPRRSPHGDPRGYPEAYPLGMLFPYPEGHPTMTLGVLPFL